MVTKKELLSNLRQYSAEEIAEAIRVGVVSLYELSKETEGAFTPLLKKQVKAILENPIPVSSNDTHKQASVDPVSEESVANPIEQNVSLDMVSSDMSKHEVENTTTTPIKKTEKMISNKGMFKRPFSFQGRIRRLEYGISSIIWVILYSFLDVAAASEDMSGGAAIFFLIIYALLIWFYCAQSCKRCHDRGHSGWYQLIPFYPIVLLFGKGQQGENDYGDDPKN